MAIKGESTEAEMEPSEYLQDDEIYILRLYVAGQTKKSLAAFANLQRICQEHLKGKYRSRSSTFWSIRSWRREIRFWPFQRSCEGFLHLSRRSSGTSLTPRGFW